MQRFITVWSVGICINHTHFSRLQLRWGRGAGKTIRAGRWADGKRCLLDLTRLLHSQAHCRRGYICKTCTGSRQWKRQHGEQRCFQGLGSSRCLPGEGSLCFQSVAIDRFALVNMEVGSFSGTWAPLNELSRSLTKRNRHKVGKMWGQWESREGSRDAYN